MQSCEVLVCALTAVRLCSDICVVAVWTIVGLSADSWFVATNRLLRPRMARATRTEQPNQKGMNIYSQLPSERFCIHLLIIRDSKLIS